MCIRDRLTFTTASTEVVDRTSELPTLVHVMDGLGFPDELQTNERLFLSTTKSVPVSVIFTEGLSARDLFIKKKSTWSDAEKLWRKEIIMHHFITYLPTTETLTVVSFSRTRSLYHNSDCNALRSFNIYFLPASVLALIQRASLCFTKTTDFWTIVIFWTIL